MKANYGISSSEKEYVITPYTTPVNWIGLYDKEYVYNGEDQGEDISVEATLLGEDLTTYAQVNYLVANFGGTAFKDAGDYIFTVEFDAKYPDLNNNYRLSNARQEKTILKAYITNLYFSGSTNWTYYAGEIHYFFVSGTAGFSESYVELKYQYDDVIIPITYVGGDSDYSKDGLVIEHNGVKNAGSYQISASVVESKNYHGWNGSITINVAKGKIDNLYLTGYSITYDALEHKIFASNNKDVVADTYAGAVLPDGSNASVLYGVAGTYVNANYNNNSYSLDWDANNNYAIDAGSYSVNAMVENSNYEKWEAKATLEIKQKDVAVIWRYNGTETANFVYNGLDQTSKVVAYVQRAGNTTEENRTISMAIDFTLDNNEVNATIRKYFAIAGSYALVATFAESDEKEAHLNNYKVSNAEVTVVMKKFTIVLKWLYGCSSYGENEVEYDVNNPCVYDKKTHSVRAKGLGLNQTEMLLTTSGTFEAVNANVGEGSYYTASVDGIQEGYDNVEIGGNTYTVSYATNYELPINTSFNWRIKQRPISLYLDTANSHLAKIYDYSNTFKIDSSSESVSEPEGEYSIVAKTITYLFSDENYENVQNKIVYVLSNIISGDEGSLSIGITAATTDLLNVNAKQVTISFGKLTTTGGASNYYVEQDITGLVYSQEEIEKIIEPRRVKASFKEGLGHVYNGLTYEMEIEENALRLEQVGIITLTDVKTGNSVAQLYPTNYFVGSFDIGGNTVVGKYSINSSFDIIGEDNVRNYAFVDENAQVILRDGEGNLVKDNVLSLLDYDYEIKARQLMVEYTNLLQSFNEEFNDVRGAIALEECDLTDLEWGIGGYEAMSEEEKESAKVAALKALLNAEAVI